MTKHQEAEQRGRERFLNDFGHIYTIVFSTDEYERFDFKATAETIARVITYVGEIKNINRDYSKFIKDGKDGGFLIDYSKVKAVVEEAEKENRIPVLVVYFNDYRIIWNLSKVMDRCENEKEERMVNKDGQHYGEKELSTVTYVYKEDAVSVEKYVYS